jgi:signal transduction histidine kinase
MIAKSISSPARFILFMVLVLILSGMVVWLAAKFALPAVLAYGLATGSGLVLLLPSILTLSRVDRMLENIIAGRPTAPIAEHRWDPFAPLARLVNRLVEAGYSIGDLRENLLCQVEATAAQQERNHLARELHDSIKQQLFSIQMSAAAVETRLPTDPASAAQALADVRRSAQEALVEMNALLQQLSPAPLEKVGLAQALRDQCEALGYRSGAAVTCEIDALPPDAQLPLGTQESLFRIVQEALSNIARHARASQVEVHLRSDEERQQIVLDIHDDGHGFDPEQVAYGNGIASIRARAAALGGQVTLESGPGQGARLAVCLPYSPPAEEVDLSPVHTSPVIGRTVLAGMLGGVLISAGLYFPWYVQILRNYAPAPYAPSPAWAILGIWIAALLALLTGWLASRWAGRGSILVGATAGGVAGITSYGLLGGSWAATQGARLLLDTGPVYVQPEPEAVRILVTAFFSIFLTTDLLFWGMLLVGMGLGALGGLLSGRGKLALSADTTNRYSFLILTPMLISSGLAMLVGLLLFTLIEGSFVELLNRYAVTGVSEWLAQAAVLVSLGIPLFFYLLAMRTRSVQLRRQYQEGSGLPSAAWEAFFLAGWAGLGALLSLFWMIQVQMLQQQGSMPANPPAVSLAGWGYSLLNAGIGLAMIILLAQIRRKMTAAGLRPPSAALYAAIVVGPLVLVLGFAALFIDWLGYSVLVALGIETSLLLYLKFRQTEPVQRFNGQAAQRAAHRAQELAAHAGAAWLGMIYGLIVPVLAMGSAAIGVQTVIDLSPYLVHSPDYQGGLPPITIQQVLNSQYFGQWAGFAGLLLLAGVMVGFALLGLSIRAWNLRKRL